MRSNADEKRRFSHWKLKEVNEWNKRGITPIHHSQDTEYLCAFFGALDVLSWFGPAVLTVVHGSSGCGLSLNSMRSCSNNSTKHVLSTNLQSHHVIYGGHDRLVQILRDVDKSRKPKVIIVITNCCSYLIGEDVNGTIQSVASELQADVLNLEVAGCDGTGFRKGAEKAFDLLFTYFADIQAPAFPQNREGRPSINLFTKRITGRPNDAKDIAEIRRMLDKINADVNTVVQMGTTYDELAALSRAKANATLCFTFGKGPMESLQRLFSQPCLPMIFPLGLEATLIWMEQVAQLLGVPNTFAQDPEIAQARKKIKLLQEKVAGREAYIWQPGVKGLATALFAAELKMKPVLFGMSYYLEEQIRPTVEILLDRGFDLDLIMVGKYQLLMQAAEKPIDERPLIFMPKKFWLGDNCANVTFNFFFDTLMGLKGIDTLAAEVENALEMVGKKDYRVFNRYIETIYQATDWEVEKKDTVKNIDSEDLKWQRWNQAK